jgi:hypothetical protein
LLFFKCFQLLRESIRFTLFGIVHAILSSNKALLADPDPRFASSIGEPDNGFEALTGPANEIDHLAIGSG